MAGLRACSGSGAFRSVRAWPSTTWLRPCCLPWYSAASARCTASSKSSPARTVANRLIDGGGVRVDGSVVSDKGLKLEAGTYVVQVGKRKFARVTLG